ncbi:MAG TPA: DUF1841 family protein [Mariprofundaceae bacterium]|nr:DUF1841 family protein [Mariprofundaceae bacterium]
MSDMVEEKREQPNREQLRAHRQVFWDAWQRAKDNLPLDAMQVRIARVIEMHPHYHHFFEDMESFLERDFQADDGTNPYLHLSLHLALEEQIATRQPAEVGSALEHMMTMKGINRHDALHIILEILAESVYFTQREGKDPDVLQYLTRLRELMQK